MNSVNNLNGKNYVSNLVKDFFKISFNKNYSKKLYLVSGIALSLFIFNGCSHVTKEIKETNFKNNYKKEYHLKESYIPNKVNYLPNIPFKGWYEFETNSRRD